MSVGNGDPIQAVCVANRLYTVIHEYLPGLAGAPDHEQTTIFQGGRLVATVDGHLDHLAVTQCIQAILSAGVAGARPEPAPKGGRRSVLPLVQVDLSARVLSFKATGSLHSLSTWNGRSALVDAYQEVLDLALFLRQSIEERVFEPSVLLAWVSGELTEPQASELLGMGHEGDWDAAELEESAERCIAAALEAWRRHQHQAATSA